LKNPDHVFADAPVTAEIAAAMRRFSRNIIPDLPDRLVAATAFLLCSCTKSLRRIRVSDIHAV
jgi:hypothetical protein